MKSLNQNANRAVALIAGVILLAGPALAIGAVKDGGRSDKVSGAGLVLMVSLQRM
jgi:hypothetical protein